MLEGGWYNESWQVTVYSVLLNSGIWRMEALRKDAGACAVVEVFRSRRLEHEVAAD